MVHTMWQRHHIRPTVFLGMGTADAPITDGERAFMVGSEIYVEENGERPTNLSEFARMLGGNK